MLLPVCILFTIIGPCFGHLTKSFEDPPPDYRPKFRYWLPDASVPTDIVAKDIRDAKAAGAGGLEILPFYLYGMGEETFHRFARQNPDYVVPKLPDWSKYGFGTPAFNALFRSSLQAAQDAGILIDYSLGPNQGQGVPSEVGTPGLAVELLMGNTTISPQGSFSAPVPQARQPSDTILSGMNFMHPLEQFGTPNLTAVIAYQVLNQTARDPRTGARTVSLSQSSFIDLMPLVKNNRTLQWTPPDLSKTWKIFSFWEAHTNQRSGDGGPNATSFIGNGSWTVDHFSKAGAARVTDFWDNYILSDNELASLLQSVGKYAWEDSMELLAALFWSPGLSDRFRKTYYEDLRPCLPTLFSSANTWNGYQPVYNEAYVFENDTRSNACQLHYRNVLNDGYKDYLSHFLEWTHSFGTGYSTQPAYNLPLQMLSDVPLVDAPEGESLGFAQLTDAFRQFSGPAHLANISVISTEIGAVRTPAYSLHMPDLLQQVKRSFAGGFTMNVLHGFPTSTAYPNTTWPGYTTFFYEFTEMWNQIQPAWQHMKDALDYIGRNQWVLQQGSPRVDLAFYLYASPWQARLQYNSTNLRDLGFTYDYLGPDNLVSSHALIKNGKLGIPGYKALIFNKQTVATVEVANTLLEMSSAGLPIIFVGPTPKQPYPASPSSESALAATMDRLLSNENVYKLNSIDQIPSLLAERSITPRASLNCSLNPVYSVWRSAGDVDFIYFFNDQPKATDCTATLRTSGPVQPCIYNAWTGSKVPLLTYSMTNSSLAIALSLNSNETLILALERTTAPARCSFTNSSGTMHSLFRTANHSTAIITSPTTLTNSSGATTHFNASLPPSQNLTTWDLVIEDWHSAPDRYAVQTETTNHTFHNISLIPWTKISPNLNRVSGVGHYTTHFTVPFASTKNSTLVGTLSLPLIQHTARVYLDGNWLGPIDPVRPVLELRSLQPGTQHEIRIDVTTTLFNRVKAEANQIWVVGQVAGQEQPLYRSMPYEAYGLVGDVVLEWGEEVVVEC